MNRTPPDSCPTEPATSHQPVDDQYLAALEQLQRHFALYTGPERSRQGFELLEALSALTAAKACRGVSLDHLGFEPAEIAEHLSWPSLEDAEPTRVGTVINAAWKKALKLFDGMREGYRETAGEQGVLRILVPRKLPSAGRVPSQYRWEMELEPGAQSPRTEIPVGGLRYRREWVDNYRVGILGLGVVLNPLRIALFLSLFSILGLLVLFLVAASYNNLRTGNLAALAVTTAGAGCLVWAMYRMYSPLADAKRWRVVAVPEFLQPLTSLEAMQLVYDPEGEHIVRAVRHVGECPRCGRRVTVDEGDRAFPDRLVGRCRGSPREHVYSFDHLSLLGQPLT